MDFTARYAKLNTAQKQAVDTIDGPVMVIAGPGTGKTELLSMRAANILRRTDVLPENILCLTFTDSGANAMRERLTKIVGPSAYKVAIHTFHSFGTEVINQNNKFFYHGAHFRAADQLSCYELLRSIFDELEYSNPLASKMNGEYTHMNDTFTTISELKKSGLTSDELLLILDANDKVMDAIEPQLAAIFEERLSKTTVDKLEPLVQKTRSIKEKVSLPTHIPLSKVLAGSIEEAVNDAHETNSTKPITAWRNAWMKKDEAGKFVLKSRDKSVKLRAVSYIYFRYLGRMQEAELYDFDDMILRVVHAMEVFPELRFNLQEQYQYIMVDEFQDTNMAQMRILYNLTNSEVSNGQPNILVVGDDDQAIYSFQGADVGNINNFRELYQQTALITLTDNYRSTERVLERSRNVIMQGTDRLENIIPDLNKTLTAHQEHASTNVALVELPTTSDERTWLAETISHKILKGTPAASIAVLARRHHELVALLPYLTNAGVKVNYERRDNVLDLEVIKIIEHVAHILVALFERRHDDADSFLPELLAHPAFGFEPMAIWHLSLTSQQNRQKWMEAMAASPTFQPLHEWLIVQSQRLAHTPLEVMLDEIIGAPKAPASPASLPSTAFVSPLFGFFFSSDNLRDTPDLYLTYLEALRTIRTKLREYQPHDIPTLQVFLDFIQTHRRLGSTITNIRPQSDRIDDAVNLMTVHKSKGLEFDNVFIVGAIDSAWGSRVRARSRLIGYPENLPLAPAGDTFDERLRLFFVAMTRARIQLTISYGLSDDNGKSNLRASFLADETWSATTPQLSRTIEGLARAAQLMWYQPIIAPLKQDMRSLLAPHLDNYKLSSTHLNNFLDITRGGPQMFLMNNLLRFPQAISPSAGYGSAIHAALQRTHSHLVATGKHRPDEDILHDFEENLQAQRLSEKDFVAYLQKGSDALSVFLKERHHTFSTTQRAELNFAHQNVRLGDAHLTGSLDLVDIDKEARRIIVTDYKTGKPARGWNGKTDYEKVKLHRYKQQLMFYNLLVRHSRDYGKYEFDKGVLQFVEPTPGGVILSLEARFSNDELNRFSQLIQSVWRHIITLDLPDVSNYDPSYKGILAFERSLLDE